MRISGESINYVLDLQKKKLPRVYCCSSIERLKDLSRGIIYYNGKVKSKLDESNDDSSLVNTLLIFLDEIKDEKDKKVKIREILFNIGMKILPLRHHGGWILNWQNSLV